MDTPPKKPEALYHHERDDYYECLGCGALIEVPRCAVLHGGSAPVLILANPENRMIWLELQTLDHLPCATYQDADKAEQARTYRRTIIRNPFLDLRGGGCQAGNANG